MNNRERAERVVASADIRLPTDIDAGWRAAIRATVDGSLTDAIEAALDEAEKRGFTDGYALGQEAVRRNPASGVAGLNAILDKVVEMDKCEACDGEAMVSAHMTGPDGYGLVVRCSACNGTGDGDIARYVKEARG